MRIGDVAAKAGVSVRSLRYYEEQGLLEAARTGAGQRSYGEGAVDRVILIQQLFSAGIPSRTIVDLLPCVATGRATQRMLEQLRHEREVIEHRMQDLSQARQKLDEVIRHVLDAGIYEGSVADAGMFRSTTA